MNLLSKPYQITFQLLASYMTELYMHPVRTKSLTSCVTAAFGNYLSQKLSGAVLLNHVTICAFAVFGLLFNGSVPHYFHEMQSKFLHGHSKGTLLQSLIIERFMFMPVYVFFSMYMLSLFEGKSHEQSFDDACAKFPTVVGANFKYLSLLRFINIFFVPPVLKALFDNIIGFIWIIYLSKYRQLKK